MDRRKFLKIIPAGFLSSIFSGKLFGNEEKSVQKVKSKPLFYEVDGVKIEQTTFFYAKEDIPKNKSFEFAAFSIEGNPVGFAFPYCFDKDGDKHISYSNDENAYKNAIYPKIEWVNDWILSDIRYAREHYIDWEKYEKLYIYVFRREDKTKEIGIFVSSVPCRPGFYSKYYKIL